jgi:hypothetical protein
MSVLAMTRGSTQGKTSYLSAGKDNLSRHEDKEHDFGFNHAIYKPREKLQNYEDLGTKRHRVDAPQAHNY